MSGKKTKRIYQDVQYINEQESGKNKLGLLELSKTLANVFQAYKIMGDSRETFYTYKELYEKAGELALQDISRKKPCHKNRVEDAMEKAVVTFVIDKSVFNQFRRIQAI